MKHLFATIAVLGLLAASAVADVSTFNFGTATTITNATTNASATVCGTAFAIKNLKTIKAAP